MVNRGYLPPDKPIPSPDMSFVRMFDDASTGWQYRGQYAFWAGVSNADDERYKLLERVGNRVARIEHSNGDPVFHGIMAGIPFTIENLMGYWLTFDSDAMWLDVPNGDDQFAVLAVGGSAGKPGNAIVDWTCVKCGESVARKSIDIVPQSFRTFLKQANAWAADFNAQPELRACPQCGASHPESYGIALEDAQEQRKPVNAEAAAS